MADRLKKLLGTHGGPYAEGTRNAWQGYKGLVRGNARGAMVGLGVAAGYGAWSEGQSMASSSIMLGPALIGIGAAVQAGGGMGMLRNVGSKVSNDINTAIRTVPDGGVRSSFLERTAPNTDYAGTANKALAGITGDVPMGMQYAAIASEINLAPGESTMTTLGQLAQDQQLGGFAGKFASKDALMARIEDSPAFAREFVGRMNDFKGMDGIATMTPTMTASKPTYKGMTREGLVGRLRRQGQGALATEIAGISPDVHIAGIGNVGDDAITALEYGFGGQSFRAPIVGPDGTFKAGIFGKNVNVARKQIFVGSLEGMMAGGTPEVVAMDIAVAKTIRTYHAAAKEVNGIGDLTRYLGKIANVSRCAL